MPDAHMVRKQVYITRAQERALAERARLSGRSQSELIREAIDLVTQEQQRTARQQVIQRVAGLWEGRTDLPDVEALRRESDRRMEQAEPSK